MPRNEEGEFELILGNRQLLSIFFLVVVLLGVFFTMGYIVGRNSGPVTSELASDKAPVTSNPPPLVVGRSSRSSAMPEPSPVEPAPVEKPKPNYDLHTDTGNPVRGPEPKKPEPANPQPKPEPKPEPKKVEAKKPEPSRPEPAKPEAKGQAYFQVVAVAKPDAERTVAALKAKSLPARIMPGPDDAIFRVVVGPLGDAAATSDLRAKLEAAGYKPIIKRF